MAPRGAAVIQLDASSARETTTLNARLSEWPGLSRLFVPPRKFLARWTEDAPVRKSDPVHNIQDTNSVVALVEADLQIMFGEIWDLVRANPRAASAVLGVVVGYIFWG